MLLLPRFSHRDPPLSDPFLDRVGTQLGSYRPGVPASRDNAVQLLSFPNPPRPPTPGPNPRPPPIPPRPPVPTPPPSPRYTAAGPEEYVAQRLSTLISKVAANWVTLCGPVLYPPPPRPPTPGPRPGPLYPRPNQPTPPPSPRRSTRESDHDLAGAGASPEVGGIIRSLSQNCQPAIGSVPLKQTSSPNIQEPIGTVWHHEAWPTRVYITAPKYDGTPSAMSHFSPHSGTPLRTADCEALIRTTVPGPPPGVPPQPLSKDNKSVDELPGLFEATGSVSFVPKAPDVHGKSATANKKHIL